MRLCCYLEADFIPQSLVASLVGEPDAEQLSIIVAELQALSLVRVVHSAGQEVELQVHRQVQACCREYQEWSLGAAAAHL